MSTPKLAAAHKTRKLLTFLDGPAEGASVASTAGSRGGEECAMLQSSSASFSRSELAGPSSRDPLKGAALVLAGLGKSY
jgi:hypothetical protein